MDVAGDCAYYPAGREREWERLRDALDVAPGERRVVFIEGAMGIGKTWLLNATAPRLRRRVLRTGPVGLGDDAPLQSLRAALRALGGGDADGPDRVAARLLKALAVRPTVLMVDDAQWVDAASVEVLARVVLESPDVVLVLAHRPTQVPHLLLETARRAGMPLDRVRLDGLDDATMEQVVGSLVGAGRDHVITRARGNPLFARLLAQLWFDRPDPVAFNAALDGLRRDEIPSVYGALRSDLRSLDREIVDVLRAIAVIGRLHVGAVLALTGLDAATVARSCEVLRARELIESGPYGTRPTHPLIRAAAYRGMDAGERLRAHRELSAMTDVFGELERAEHLHLLGEHQSADDVEMLVATAAVALVEDPRAAVRWLFSTLHLAHPGRDVLLARALVVCGQWERAATILDALPAESQTKEVRALRLQTMRMAGDLDAAQRLLDEAVSVDDPAFQVERAVLAIARDKWESGVEELELYARTQADPDADSAVSLAAGILRALARLNVGDINGARAVFDPLVPVLESTPSARWHEVVEVFAHAGWVAYFLERFDDAVRIVDSALQVAREHTRVHAFAHLHTVRAFAMVSLGRIDEAARAADAAVENARTFASVDDIPIALTARLFVAEWRGDAAGIAAAEAELAAAELPAGGWWRRIVASIALRVTFRADPSAPPPLIDQTGDALLVQRLIDGSLMHLAQGANDEARRMIARARDVASGQGLPVQEAYLAMGEARIAAHADRDPQRAAALARSAKEAFERARMPLHHARASVREREYCALAEESPASRLTPREHEIAQLVARGLANKEIATVLSISPRTVEEHVGRVLRKLDVASRAAVGLVLGG